MKPVQPTPTLPAAMPRPVVLTPAAGARLGPSLTPGRVLDAVVVATTGRSIVLDLEGARVETRSSVPLPAGRPFPVRVQGAGQPLVLEVLDPEIRGEAARSIALRNALPRQLPVAEALRALPDAQPRPGARTAPTPQPAAPRSGPALESLASWVPDASRLGKAQELARVMRDSGVLLEAKLARAARDGGPARVEGDLKALLLRAAAALATDTTRAEAAPAHAGRAPGAVPPAPHAAGQRPPPPGAERHELRVATTRATATPTPVPAPALVPGPERAVEGALSRLQINQLASGAPAEPDGAHWHVEIPVRQGAEIRTLDLVVRRDGSSAGERDEPIWSVDLTMDLGDLGPLHGRVTLADGKVGAALWAPEPETARLVRSGLGELRRELEDAGLQVGRLSLGRVPPAQRRPMQGAGSLLRTEA